jgi:hypothetical protein
MSCAVRGCGWPTDPCPWHRVQNDVDAELVPDATDPLLATTGRTAHQEHVTPDDVPVESCLAEHSADLIPVGDALGPGRFDCTRCLIRFDFSRMPWDRWATGTRRRLCGRSAAFRETERPCGRS